MTPDEIDSIVARTVEQIDALSLRSVPSIRIVRRKLSSELRDAGPEDVLAAARGLARRGLRWVGYELIHHHPRAMASMRSDDVEALAKGLESWNAVDAFGAYIAGPAWRNGQIADSDVRGWAKSQDPWRRRLALVATTVLNARAQGGGDARRTLMVASLLMSDREDTVVKAMSWALRSLAARDPEAVRRFLAEHDARLAARVKRETRNKLETGRKSGRV